MIIEKKIFGYRQSQPVYLYTIKNDRGMEFSCTNYGCIITKIAVPDIEDKIENIVLSFDSLEEYEKYSSSYFGAVVGRFAGRINGGKFSLDGREYQITQNEGENHLHGGKRGFSNRVWKSCILEKENEVSIHFSHISPNGEEGYPGNLEMKVVYTITNENELYIEYKGTADQMTILNVTNHTYFNLSGDLKRDIQHHTLMIDSDSILELDEKLIPTGLMLDVEDTVFDFRKGRLIYTGIQAPHPQIIQASNGYDHPFILNKENLDEIVLVDSDSGRKLEISTDECCVILYTGNMLGEGYQFKGVPSKNYLGLCLETQGPPDSVNHSHFKSAVLEKDKLYHSKTKYHFTLV